jgi:hypothetical protein
MPCSVFSPLALSLSSQFPQSSYKYAANPSYGLVTVAVCTDASIQEFQTSFQNQVASSVLFTSRLFQGRAQIVLPDVGNSNFDPKAPFRISDFFSQLKLGPYNPSIVKSPAQYSSCCSDSFCIDQLRSSDSHQPYKFVWGAIGAITSTQPSKACRDLMGCDGTLSMVPVAGMSNCTAQNVYVVQAIVSNSWIFRLLFLFFFSYDILVVLLQFTGAIVSRFIPRFPMTPESFHKFNPMPIEFYQQLQAAGNLDRFGRSTQGLAYQFAADALEMNPVTSAFGEFYNLLHEQDLFSNVHIIECIELYKGTAFGNEVGTYQVTKYGRTITFPKHWKATASRMSMSMFRMFFCFASKILVDLIYPSLMLASSPCQTYQQIYHILVICKAAIGISKSFFHLFKSTFRLHSKIAQ